MKFDKNVNRKEFLKLTGIAALLGVGGKTGFSLYASGQESAEDSTENKIRYGLLIDTKKCPPGCTDCIDVCHSKHNVPSHDSKKDEIKWIWKEPAKHLFPEDNWDLKPAKAKENPLLTLCNHCKNPPCVRVCPTQATFKRDDGIVMMDYHRCIGCRFCMAGCPYGSRSFNYKDPRKGLGEVNSDYPTRTIGVVEKCNFCAEKIGDGSAPHCVEKCTKGAIVFGDLNDPESEIRKAMENDHVLRRKAELGTEPSVMYKV